MEEHYCQIAAGYMYIDVIHNLLNECSEACGKVAHFKHVYSGGETVWLCAEHYDVWTEDGLFNEYIPKVSSPS